MPDEFIYLNFSAPVIECQTPGPITPCPAANVIEQEDEVSSQQNRNLSRPVADGSRSKNLVSIDVKSNVLSFHKFRAKLTVEGGQDPSTDLCTEPAFNAGKSFVEVSLKILSLSQ